MTWQQRFDEIWQDELIQEHYSTAPDFLKGFISSLLEEVINEIPEYPIGSSFQIEDFKQQLKDKYGIK